MPLASDSRVPALIETHDREMAIAHDCSNRQRRLADAVGEQEATAWRWYCDVLAALAIEADGCEVSP